MCVGLWVCGGVGLPGPVGEAAAQAYASETPKRLVHRYDFEDVNDQGVKLGQGLTLPPGWYPAGRDPQSRDPNFGRLVLHDRLSRRPGFPPHNPVGYSARGQARSGDYSLHLGINGGSSSAYLEVGALPAVPGSDYLITAKVATAGLEHAAARVRAYFVDPAGQRIEESVRRSSRLRTQGAWAPVDLVLPGEYADAAYIGLEVELVQPVPDVRDLLGNQQVVLTDVKGDAWFDDVAVWQLPHVEIGTSTAVNIVRGDPGPDWHVAVRDLVGGRLTARLTVYDHAMNVVAESRRPMGWGAPSKWKWSPTLPGYGWYLAELAVLEGVRVRPRGAAMGRVITIGGDEPITIDTPAPPEAPPEAATPEAEPGPGSVSASASDDPAAAQEQVIARTYNAVLWLPPGTGAIGADAERFALDATGMSGRALTLLPEVARAVGLGTTIVSAWDRETTLGALDLRLAELQRVVGPLRNAGQRVELSFSPLPEALVHTRGVNTTLPAGLFGAPTSLWMPYVQPILVRQGQRVNTWHLGSADRPEAAYLPALGETLAGMYDEFRHWTPAPLLSVPWRMDQPARDDLPTRNVAYAVGWPLGVVPTRLADHVPFGRNPGPGDTPSVGPGGGPVDGGAGLPRRLHLEIPGADLMPHPARVTDLALRMVHAWEQNGTGVALSGLWTPGLERRASLLPDPLLGVAANVAARLAGYRAIGRLHLGEDRAAVIFEDQPTGDAPSRGGMLVAWNVSGRAEAAELSMFLGDRAVRHDVWGNALPLEVDAEGKHRVQLSDAPVFITGIDAKIALLRSGFVLDRAFVESTQTPHLRLLTLTNPWPVTISGKLVVTGPESWTIKPQRHVFSIGPGRSLRLPIALRFPVNEVAGTKQLTAQLEFTADRKYEIELATPLRLGLEDVMLEASLALEPRTLEDGTQTVDAAVTCIVTNTGDQEMSLNIFAKLPGFSRKERLIPQLEPGQAAIRQFRFPAAAAALTRSDIRLGVRETNGPAVLNKRVGVHNME